MKYTLEFKLRCIQMRKTGEKIIAPPGVDRRKFMKKTRIRELLYDKHGVEGIRHKIVQRTFEEKKKLIYEVINGKSINEVAINAGLLPSTLSNWFKIFREKGLQGLKLLQRGRPSTMNNKKKNPEKPKNKDEYIKELEAKLMYIEAENEYLKKLQALIQKKGK